MMAAVLVLASGLFATARVLRLAMRWAGWRLELVPLPGALGLLWSLRGWLAAAGWLLAGAGKLLATPAGAAILAGMVCAAGVAALALAARGRRSCG